MENGAVYRPTTEENSGPARGARGGLAACFNLSRLKLSRLVIKGLQLVSRWPRRASRRGRCVCPWAIGLWLGRLPSQLSPTWWFRKRPFPHPGSFPVRLGRGGFSGGPLPPRAAPRLRGSLRLGPRWRLRATEPVRRVQEMRRSRTRRDTRLTSFSPLQPPSSALPAAVPPHCLPKCLPVDCGELSVYLHLVLAFFLVRARGSVQSGGQSRPVLRTVIKMCAFSKWPPKSFVLIGKELFPNGQPVCTK